MNQPFILFDTAPTAKTIFGVAWVTSSQFVFVGDQTFMLWTEHAPGQGYTFETAQLKPGEKLVSVKVASNKDILTGNNLGDLTIWRGVIQTKVVRAHAGVLDAIEVNSNFIFTGAKDCTIKLFNNHYEEIAGAAIDLYASIPTCFDAHIRALAFDEVNNRLAVGVIAGEIYEFDLKDTQSKTGPVEIVKSHFSKSNQGNDEVHGLAIRDEDFFLTVGHDGTLREWSISKRKCYRSLNLNIDENGMMLGPNFEQIIKKYIVILSEA